MVVGVVSNNFKHVVVSGARDLLDIAGEVAIHVVVFDVVGLRIFSPYQSVGF